LHRPVSTEQRDIDTLQIEKKSLVKPVPPPKSPIDSRLKLMWRLLRLAFWLSAVPALLYMLANFQRGRLSLALMDGVALAALALGYRVSVRLGRPEVGIGAIAVIDWLVLAMSITMHGGLRSPAISWIVLLAPLLMLGGLKLALAMTAATVALIAGLYVAEVSGWMPPYLEVPLLQRAVSAVLIACIFALSAWYALRWRERLAGELEAVRDAAIEANRLKGRFIANLNHEIRTPMNALVAAAQLLGRQQLRGEQRSLVQVVQHSADHLLALVNDVLDYERLEAGEVRLDALEFSLRELTTSTLAIFGPQAQGKQLSLSLDLVAGLPDIWIGDPTRLRQVLCNLLSNSIKFTPEHGRIVLRVAGAAMPEGGSSLCFEVVDSGPGITADAQARLFQPYGQGDASITRRFGGTGLGLLICKELLRLMKGSIEVESQPGAGSTFRVAVPLVPAPHEGHRLRSTEPMAQADLPAGLNVMLVEDDIVNQTVMEAMLRDLGVQVLTADSGEQALELMERRAVDLVLMDCHLPGIDGLTTTRRWRGKEARLERPRVRVIGLTGDVYSGAREACLEAGMDDYLAKPASRADIGAVLARWAPRGSTAIGAGEHAESRLAIG
jgi:signal transduction histidine kinase/ActR/RegA family two-component response regulator